MHMDIKTETIYALGYFRSISILPTPESVVLRDSDLYCFFVLSHDRRCISHWNVTRHPGSSWVVQQLREGVPCGYSAKYLIFDRAADFSTEVVNAVTSLGQ